MPTLWRINPDDPRAVLNRIYIVVGMLAIIVLGGAFIAPYLIQWGDYRTRMEELAGGVLGTPVTIRGDIAFALLPQPRLSFSDVLVGSPEEPAATVDSVEAEFSLMDFLRDNYDVTRLVLRGPVLDFSVDENGLFGSGVNVDSAGGGVALGHAAIVDGTIRLMDRRAGQNFVADDVDGDLRLSSFSGPFQFQGSAVFRSARYTFRLNSSQLDGEGHTRLSVYVQPDSGAFSFASEGLLTPGMAPRFDGAMTYRETPPLAQNADEIRGDLVLESKMTASTDRIVLTGYTLQPDENRAGTRLTGAASIQLGARQSFDAVVSGGVFSLPPRDAKEDPDTKPYEAVRLLSELPAPLMPPMAGRIGIDLAEVGLRGFALRNVRMDATTDGSVWIIDQFLAQLPGDTAVRASGELRREADYPAFRGQFSLSSGRLDGLASLWRKPAEDNALFNQSGSLSGNVMLTGDALRVSEGQLTLNETAHSVEVRVGFGEEKRLDVVGQFAALGVRGSTVLGAMLPDGMAEPGFGNSFPEGSFSLRAQRAQLLGYDGTALVAEGQWNPHNISVNRLSAGDWGGLGFDVTAEVGGTLAAPIVTGSGRVGVGGAQAPALAGLYDLFDVPAAWRDYLAASAPAEMLIDLEPGASDTAQVLTLGGTLGAGKLDLRAELEGGLAGMVRAPLRLTASLEGTDSAALGVQLGLGADGLFGADDMLVSLGLEGTPSNSLDSRINLSAGDEAIGFSGYLVATDRGEIQGTGSLDVALGNAGGLAQIVGAQGLSLPPVTAQAQMHFEGARLLRLTDMLGQSDETGFSGTLSYTQGREAGDVSGEIAVDTLSAEGLAATLFGRAGMIGGGDAVWPEGPISIGALPRQTRGNIAVTAQELAAGEQARTGPASLDLIWDETRVRLARFEAAIGEGTARLDISVCCAGPLADKTVSGRVSLDGVRLDAVAPPAIVEMLSGTLEGGVQFNGTGASLAEVIRSLAGEGNFGLANFAVQQLSPGVFETLAGLEDVLNTDGDALRAIAALALGQGEFDAPSAGGAFSIAGGVIRLNNLIVDGAGARLAGGLSLALDSLGLNGDFAMTPLGFSDEAGLIVPDTARILLLIGGTLLTPDVQLDLDEIVAAVQVRANEMEVDRLEALRAADAERQRAAAEARNALIEAQRQKAAEEEAARQAAAAEEAARLAAEEAARQQEAPAQTAPAQSPIFEEPLDLGLPPAVNQRNNFRVNEPLF